MAAPSAVEATAPNMEAASAAVEAAKAGLSSGCVASRNPSMAEPAKGAGVRSCLCVGRVGPVKSLMPGKTSVT
jgi:hypothetical protein